MHLPTLFCKGSKILAVLFFLLFGSISQAALPPISDSIDIGGQVVPSPIPIVITNVQESGLTSSSAIISWETDINASCRLFYGETLAYELGALDDPGPSLLHSLSLSSLDQGTLYYYRIYCWNGTQTGSDDANDFATLVEPPDFDVIANGTKGEFDGTGPPNGTIHLTILRDGVSELTASVPVDASGNWTYESPDLDVDEYEAVAYASLNGYNSVNSSTETFEIIDLEAPDFDVEVNDDNEAEIDGTGPPNSVIHLTIKQDGDTIITEEILTDSNGNWSYTTDELDPDEYEAVAYATKNGITSPDSDTKDFEVVDLDAPDFTVTVTDDKRAVIVGTGPKNAVIHLTILLDDNRIIEVAVSTDTRGNWSYTTGTLDVDQYESVAYAKKDGLRSQDSDKKPFTIYDLGIDPPTLRVQVVQENIAVIQGEGPPEGIVHLSIYQDGEKIIEVQIPVDSNGKWSHTTDELDPDLYEAVAYAIKDGLTSPNSDVAEFEIDVSLERPMLTVTTTSDKKAIITGTGPENAIIHLSILLDTGVIIEVEIPTDGNGNWTYTTNELKSDRYEAVAYATKDGYVSPNSNKESFVISAIALFPRSQVADNDFFGLSALISNGGWYLLAIAIAFAVLTVSQVGSVAGAALLFPHALNAMRLFPILACFRKKKGFVYDAGTGGPVALAKVTLYDTNGNKIDTKRTNKYGLFNIKGRRGAYKLVVEKEGHVMLFENEFTKSPTLYDKSYARESTIQLDSDGYIEHSVPFRRTEKASALETFMFRKEVFLAIRTLFFAGIIISLLFIYYYPIFWNIMICVSFLFFYLLHRANVARSYAGIVTNKDQVAFPSIPVFIKNAKNGILEVRTRTSSEGKFAVVLGEGMYDIAAGKDTLRERSSLGLRCMKWIGSDVKIGK